MKIVVVLAVLLVAVSACKKKHHRHDSKPTPKPTTQRPVVVPTSTTTHSPTPPLQTPPPAPPNSHLIVSPFFNATPNCTKSGRFCSPDCQSILYCSQDLEPFLVNCNQQTGKSYCDDTTAECVDHIKVCAGDPKSLCLTPDGKFPNIENCKMFIQCTNGNPFRYECQNNTYYNQSSGLCQENLPCQDYSPQTGICKNRTNQAIPYENDTKFFVICTADKAKLLRCDGEESNNILFDPKKGVCAFMCPGMGLFKDPNDPHSYYECVQVNKEWQSTKRECPDEGNFNDEKKVCEQATTPKPKAL